jgi:hypothetical protein
MADLWQKNSFLKKIICQVLNSKYTRVSSKNGLARETRYGTNANLSMKGYYAQSLI